MAALWGLVVQVSAHITVYRNRDCGCLTPWLMAGAVTPNLVPSKSCPAWALIEYKLYTAEALRLGYSIDKMIGGQLAAGDHSRHYRASMQLLIGVPTHMNSTYDTIHSGWGITACIRTILHIHTN